MNSPAAVSGHYEQVRLVPGVSCAGRDGVLYLLTWRRSEPVGADLDWKRALLATLAREGCQTAGPQGPTGGAPVAEFLASLMAQGWLISTVGHQGRRLYTLIPCGSLPRLSARVRDDLVLSRFTVMHREDDRLVIESPLAHARMEVHDPTISALLGYLVTGGTPDSQPGGSATEVLARLWADLQRAGLAVPRGSEEDFRSLQWKPHELWFHHQSRMTDRSFTAEGYGRTHWAKGRFAAPPARHERYSGPAIALHRPDLDKLRAEDPPLTAVIEDRRSVRVYDDEHPITVEQLGDLLYRCARVRVAFEADGVEHVSLPYPAGGAMHELELYPVVRQASGLSPGMYHYDAHEHALRLVCPAGPQTHRILGTAARSTLKGCEPQTAIVISARFGRLMWTYEQMPYSLVLKDVGVLQQNLYLVATAMGLAACALGGGDARTFNEATGADYAVESAVGEFLVGSLPPGDDQGGRRGPTAAS